MHSRKENSIRSTSSMPFKRQINHQHNTGTPKPTLSSKNGIILLTFISIKKFKIKFDRLFVIYNNYLLCWCFYFVCRMSWGICFILFNDFKNIYLEIIQLMIPKYLHSLYASMVEQTTRFEAHSPFLKFQLQYCNLSFLVQAQYNQIKK